MATSDGFVSGITGVLVGLLRDAQTDEAYDYVMPLHDAWETATKSTSKTRRVRKAILESLRNEPTFRDCVRGHDTTLLFQLLMKELPSSLAGSLREVSLSLDNRDLFRDDTIKKMWKRIKKIIITLDLYDYVYGAEARGSVATKQPSKFVLERRQRFNTAYRTFIELLCDTFPPSRSRAQLLEAFDATIAADDTQMLEQFKKVLLPSLPDVARAIQLQQQKEDPAVVAAVFDPYFGDDPSWFKRLPFTDKLPIDEHWTKLIAAVPMPDISKTASLEEARQVLEASPKHRIMRTIGDLAVTMSGIDSLLYSPIVTHLRNKALDIMQRDKMNAQALLPTSTSFDQSASLAMVMELFREIPEATGNKVSQEDIEQLLANAMTGCDDIPESFAEVFSPDMIDFDCLDVVSELPMIGDVLGPIMASAEGQMRGVTGSSAFSSVGAPAWMQRDADSS